MTILCGDIGGTKTLLQLAAVSPSGEIAVVDQQRYPSAGYADFDLVLTEFLERHRRAAIAAACFGVAGPVMHHEWGESATITNLPWQLDSRALASRFGLGRVRLINDFEAVGYGIEALPPADLVTLQAGMAVEHGNLLVIGAGTGLGVALLVWSGGHYQVVPTEGGHFDFAPATPRQLDLARFLMERFGRGSMEHLLSGPGLVNIYTFLAEEQGLLDSGRCKGISGAPDPAAAISASVASDPLASAALELFVEIYGTEAGNFALAALATGGVYIAGGIAPKIINRLQDIRFITAFRNKGKMAPLVERIPVRVVMNGEIGLLGCRMAALRSLSSSMKTP